MDKFSTLNLTMNVVTSVFELWDKIQDFQIFETIIPYDLVFRVPQAGGPLSSNDLPIGFEERGYHILDDSTRIRAVVEGVIHKATLVNFNVLTFPKEWMKASVIQSTFRDHLGPYFNKFSTGEWLVNDDPPCLIKHDQGRGLIFQYRDATEKPPYLGFSIIDDRFA